MTYTYKELHKLLRENIVNVRFTKRDGSERLMICTLMDEYLPETANLAIARDPQEKNMNVWDLEVQGWRGFKMFSIKSIELDHSKVVL